MSVRAADLRFLLPVAPVAAVPGPSVQGLSQALESAGIRIVGDHEAADVQFTSSAGPIHRGARSFVVRGWPATTGRWRGPGREVTRCIVKWGPVGPVLVATATPAVRRYLARSFSRPTTSLGRLRNGVIAGPIGGCTANLLVSAEPGVPYPIGAALRGDVGGISGWMLSFRQGDDLQRIVAMVFRDGADSPASVIKFGRLPGAPLRSDTEARILDELVRVAPDLAARATRVERRGELGGSEFTVEPAAPGSVLTAYLQRTPANRSIPLVERVLRWAAALAGRTARRDRLFATVSRERLVIVPGEQRLAEQLGRVPTVLAHQDLGSWNILTDGREFTVVDWESATTTGLPLSDVFYLATDTLAELHGPRDVGSRPRWCADLWAGALPASALLQRWALEAAAQADVPARQVGALATACWLHHGESHARRASHLADGAAAAGYLGLLAPLWREDPRLGLDWGGFSSWPTA